MRKSIKLTAAVGSAALVLTTAGIAYAYWTTTGSGDGTATTSAGDGGTAEFLEVTQNTPALTDMYPGDDPQGFTANVKNVSTDGSSVWVTSVKAYLTVVGGATCDAADYLLNGSSDADSAANAVELTWSDVEIASGDDVDTGTGDTIQFNDKVDNPLTTSVDEGENQDDCKGATVTIHYLAS